jgi:DNA mismatch repair ATPase MutS
MAKCRKRIDMIPGQGSIFDIIEKIEKDKANHIPDQATPGQLNLDASIRELITEALKKTTLSRYQVAAAMSRDLGREVTKAMLDSWSAESKEANKFPLAYLNAFMKATGDKQIIRLTCSTSGGYYIESEDALRLELGKIAEERKKLSEKERFIRDYLESMTGRITK